jgi:hypothetical protein
MFAHHSVLAENNKMVFRCAPILFLLIGSLLLIHASESLAVPALDNESLVVAVVLEKTLIDSSTIGIDPAQRLWRMKLRIVSVESVAGAEDVLRGQEGKIIEVFSNEVNAPAGASSRIKARISFHGDERGGRYWIIGTNETKSK